MTATVLAAATPAPTDAFHLADTLAQIDLRNGCVPKSAAFVHRYLLDHPRETGNLYFLPLPDDRGGEDGHAVALFTHAREMWLYDYELGVIPTYLPTPTFDWSQARALVAKLLRERLRATVAVRRAEQGSADLPPAPACADQVLAAGAMLSHTMKVAVIKVGPEGAVRACAWDLVGRVWIYSPDHGTAWSTPDGQKPYRELVNEGLAKFGIRDSFELYHLKVRTPASPPAPAG